MHNGCGVLSNNEVRKSGLMTAGQLIDILKKAPSNAQVTIALPNQEEAAPLDRVSMVFTSPVDIELVLIPE